MIKRLPFFMPPAAAGYYSLGTRYYAARRKCYAQNYYGLLRHCAARRCIYIPRWRAAPNFFDRPSYLLARPCLLLSSLESARHGMQMHYINGECADKWLADYDRRNRKVASWRRDERRTYARLAFDGQKAIDGMLLLLCAIHAKIAAQNARPRYGAIIAA